MEKKKREVKTGVLYLAAAILAIAATAVVGLDVLLARIYSDQQASLGELQDAAPVPVIRNTPAPAVTPAPKARTPLFGDIPDVAFPDDTTRGADYGYRSDNLMIAVNKVQEVGVTYYVADIWTYNISCFRTAFSSGKYKGKREDPEKISRDNNAILAVNGDFLGGLAIRNGQRYNEATERDMAAFDTAVSPVLTPSPPPMPIDFLNTGYVQPTPRPERSTCVLFRDGTVVTEEFDTFKTGAVMKKGAWQGWQFGPTLIRNGKPADDVNKQGRNPRCILGYYSPGHYCLIVIDGRQKGYSVGMNYEEMIDLCLSLGLREAYNLDGGGSAVMTFNGEIINSPSGSGEARKLSDMIVIGEYTTPDYIRPLMPTPKNKK